MEIPFSKETVNEVLQKMHIPHVGNATIRQTVALSEELEKITGQKFVHLEMGSPGLPASQIGIEAQKKALDSGVAQKYPNISGIAPLKKQASRFVKAFLNVDINPEGCIPTVGSMMGTFASFIVTNHLDEKKDTILFINPGFSVQPLQANVLGYKKDMFDVYDFRGKKLKEELERHLAKGNIAAILYSNPNNPTWVCFTEEEAYIIDKAIDSICPSNRLKGSLKDKLLSVYDTCSLQKYSVSEGLGDRISTLSRSIRNKEQVILRRYCSSHSESVRDRRVEPFSFTLNCKSLAAYDLSEDLFRD